MPYTIAVAGNGSSVEGNGCFVAGAERFVEGNGSRQQVGQQTGQPGGGHGATTLERQLQADERQAVAER